MSELTNIASLEYLKEYDPAVGEAMDKELKRQRRNLENICECCEHGANEVSRSPLHLSYLTLFHIQQPFFLIQPARIAGQLPIRSDHPVTGNY